ncbi:VOC family protein [Fontivita pretiosa]|uniref:VOC family protein n=1 Tax=Fontivita pretiosa TaxID=2989684 RepID=UPI003D18297B
MEHLELEQAAAQFKPVVDRRRPMPEPPPVWLVAVEDVHAPAAAGLETQLDEFYIGLLRFERQQVITDQIVYKAENVRLCIDVVEPPVHRLDLRPIGIEVPSLAALEQQLAERQIEYEWQKGLTPGSHTLLLRDPAGNWVQIGERQRIL